MRTRLRAALLLAAALTAVGPAWADPNPGNDAGQFTVRITPNVDLGVTVDTAGANWQGEVGLDVTMDLGVEQVTENGILVEVAGNFNRQELQLTGAALNTWTLDTDETPDIDQVRLYAMFGDPTGTVPDNLEFAGAGNLVTTAPRRAGQPQADEDGATNANHVYELDEGAVEYADIDDLTVGTQRALYLRADSPPTSTTSDQQAFTVTVTAVTGAGQ